MPDAPMDENVVEEDMTFGSLEITVVDSNGESVATVEDGSLTFEATAEMTYFVSVSSADGNSGRYQLMVLQQSDVEPELFEEDSESVEQQWLDGLWEEGADWMEQLFLMG